jgi:hypothetical protein
MSSSDTSVCEEDLETRPPSCLLLAAQRNLSEKSLEDKNLLDEVIASMMQDPVWKREFSSDFNAFRAESKVRVRRLKLRRATEDQSARDESCSDFITTEGHSVITVS